MTDITRATGRLIAAVDSGVTALRLLVEVADNQRLATVLADIADLLDGARYEAIHAAAREGDRILAESMFQSIGALDPAERGT